jgi:hypothetical protein
VPVDTTAAVSKALWTPITKTFDACPFSRIEQATSRALEGLNLTLISGPASSSRVTLAFRCFVFVKKSDGLRYGVVE